jgi:hypothetical protein
VYYNFKESTEEVDTSEALDENEINVLAPNSPIIEKPLLLSCIALCTAVVLGFIAHYTLCRRRRKQLLKNNAGKCAVLVN